MHLPYINFHLSGFKVNGGTFYNSEEYIQVDLATLYNNDITIAKIMVTKILCEIKMHGNNVEGFILKKWEHDGARNAVYTSLLNKFGQNEELKNRLIKTGENQIFKVTVDRPWDCALKLNSTTLIFNQHDTTVEA